MSREGGREGSEGGRMCSVRSETRLRERDDTRESCKCRER